MPRRTDPEQVARALRAYDERNRPAIAPLAREFRVPYETLRIRIRQRSSDPTRIWNFHELQREHPLPMGGLLTTRQSNMTPDTDSLSRGSSADSSSHGGNGVYKLLEGKPLDVCERWIREYIETLPESFRDTVRNPPGSRMREFEESNEGAAILAGMTSSRVVDELFDALETPDRDNPYCLARRAPREN